MKTTMRRKNQALSEEECIAVLRRGTSGVLAAAGEDDYPYAVPLSYVYCDFKLYFHCAKEGHKLEAIAATPRCLSALSIRIRLFRKSIRPIFAV